MKKDVRILPMSKDDEEFRNMDIQELQESFFIKKLINGNEKYRFMKKSLNANDGDLVLFQYDNNIIASAIYKEKIKYSIVVDEYCGEYIFYKGTFNICNPISSDELKKYCLNFKRYSDSMQNLKIINYNTFLERLKQEPIKKNNYDLENKKRVNSKEDWLDILNNENEDDNIVIETFLYMLKCRDYTSNGKNIAKYFNISKFVNMDFVKFGERIVKLKKIEEQFNEDGTRRYWNIPFTTVPSKNIKNIFTWKLRKELVEALKEKYNLDNDDTETKIKKIDCNLRLVELDYIGNHEIRKSKKYRAKTTPYEIINRNKKTVGDMGETAVIEYEKNKLVVAGKTDLANNVDRVENDALGYDVLSFREDGTEKHIEVKINSSNNKYIDFYLTDSELENMISDTNFYLYYIYDIDCEPKLHILDKNFLLNNKDYLKPIVYKVSIDIQDKSN